mmetsp:Transcript_12773/g.45245  ORF Transcript_12773/g.45245 Transcript_12773/m.45245 type:complete len:219 (-) Transcript_12773:172-828(-)
MALVQEDKERTCWITEAAQELRSGRLERGLLLQHQARSPNGLALGNLTKAPQDLVLVRRPRELQEFRAQEPPMSARQAAPALEQEHRGGAGEPDALPLGASAQNRHQGSSEGVVTIRSMMLGTFRAFRPRTRCIAAANQETENQLCGCPNSVVHPRATRPWSPARAHGARDKAAGKDSMPRPCPGRKAHGHRCLAGARQEVCALARAGLEPPPVLQQA